MYILPFTLSPQMEFENVMRKQIRHMAQSKLMLMPGVRSAEETEFMQFGTLKLMFMEQAPLPHPRARTQPHAHTDARTK